jgi:hypothetical protein
VLVLVLRRFAGTRNPARWQSFRAEYEHRFAEYEYHFAEYVYRFAEQNRNDPPFSVFRWSDRLPG